MSRITPEHWLFHINGKLEYALFLPKGVETDDQIAEFFFKNREWKWYTEYFGVKSYTWQREPGLRSFQITVKLKKTDSPNKL